MNDDFNTSLAITHWIGICKEIQAAKGLPKESADKMMEYFEKISKVFFGDLKVAKPEHKIGKLTEPEIKAMIIERNKARANKDFKLSDRIRENLEKNGIKINDSKDSTTWSY